MNTTNDGGIHSMVMKAAQTISTMCGLNWDEMPDSERKEAIQVMQAALTECGALECLEALERLARLGNGEHYGNSDGNMIARDTISKVYWSASE